MKLAALASRLSDLPQVPGRLEVVSEAPTVLRDYAHHSGCSRARARCYQTLCVRQTDPCFGAGGDRDAGKRPEMGAAAERGADIVIATSDNPRTEDPEKFSTT